MRNRFYSIISVLLLNVLASTGATAYVEEIAETLNCKIKDTLVMAAEDGIPRRYNNYTDGFKENDILTLQIKLKKKILRVELTRANNDAPPLLFDFFRLGDIHKSPFPGEPKLSMFSEINRAHSYIDADTMIFRPKKFNSPKLDMGRYYKSDWDGTFVTSMNKQVQTAILDCRTVGQSRMDQLMKVLTKAAEK